MMNRKRLMIVLAMAVATGGLAGWLALGYLQQPATAALAPPQRSLIQLAVASRDLPLGSILQPEDVKLLDWPAEVLPMGYAASAGDLAGRGLITPVSANEPILSSKLADREGGGGLPILIPEGMRAISVRVDEVIQVAGFVTAGTRVDVLLTFSLDGPTQTRTILQNIQALAAGQTIERDVEGKPQTVSVITLLVTPEQAERLALAANEGRIQLALRNLMDGEEIFTGGARLSNLMEAPRTTATGTRRVSVPAQPRPQPTVVETLRGGERSLRTF
jgi:pilus assembly protein CpaB